MSREKIIVANWKMNPASLNEAENLLLDIVKFSNLRGGFTPKGEKPPAKTVIIIAPPFIYLEKLKEICNKINKQINKTVNKKKNNRIRGKLFLAAQDISNTSNKDNGPFTGDISAMMLKNVGIDYVILGHSERRALGEGNSQINKKIKSAIKNKIYPILCIGERTREEENNTDSKGKYSYLNFLKNQIEECLAGIQKNDLVKLIIAYEPIWSISTTPNHKEAQPSDSNEMVIFIRKVLSNLSSLKIASKIKIFYGGSVNKRNADDFLKHGGVDGLLVGGTSLNPNEFAEIIKLA